MLTLFWKVSTSSGEKLKDNNNNNLDVCRWDFFVTRNRRTNPQRSPHTRSLSGQY